MGKKLANNIRERLSRILDMKTESISVRLSELKREYPHLTAGAAAQMLAKKNGKSLMGLLTEEDKKSLPPIHISGVPVKAKKVSRVETRRPFIKPVLVFPTTDGFVRRHIEEINGTYAAHCYTATFILCRKVLENLIVEILKTKFPNSKDRGLYEDSTSHKFLDFVVVLDNLYKKRGDFSTTAHNAIERLNQKATPFRKDANDKAHSLFHIATKSEIEGAELQVIFELVMKIMKEAGL